MKIYLIRCRSPSKILLTNIRSYFKEEVKLLWSKQQVRSGRCPLLPKEKDRPPIEANRRLQAENEKAQNTFKEAVTKTEDAKRILALT